MQASDRLPVGAALAVAAAAPAPRASLPSRRKKRRKKRRKNRGGDITPMRLRRSLFFVAPATPAGTPSRRKPGETVQALPGRAGCVRLLFARRPHAAQDSRARGAFVLSKRAAPDARALRADDLRPRRREGACWSLIRCRTGPFGSPLVPKGRTTKNRRPDRRARRQITACLPAASHYCLLTSVHDCPALVGIGRHWSDKNIAPEQVSAHRQPFSVGLTTCAVHRSSRRPPGCFRCGERKMNPC